MINNVPYDETNSVNPWLMNKNSKGIIIGPEGIPLTSDYIWSKSGTDREALVDWVFNYYRKKSFPYIDYSAEFDRSYKLLVKKDPQSIVYKDNILKNTDSCCTNICKHFNPQLYYARGSRDSLYTVFMNDELFRNVLKNRMGYCKSREDGHDRPYVFSITDKMILQGMASIGYAQRMSMFKPMVAKYIYSKYSLENVFDYSTGWGARCLGAISLGRNYYGVDPMTADNIVDIIKRFNGVGHVYKQASEREFPDNIMNRTYDFIFSSPPYFNLEKYSNCMEQCYNKYSNYNDWLELYWKQTVKNCLKILNGYFSFTMVDKFNKFNIASDMISICEECGLKIDTIYEMKTSNSHLTNKKTTGKKTKNTDKIYILKKC